MLLVIFLVIMLFNYLVKKNVRVMLDSCLQNPLHPRKNPQQNLMSFLILSLPEVLQKTLALIEAEQI